MTDQKVPWYIKRDEYLRDTPPPFSDQTDACSTVKDANLREFARDFRLEHNNDIDLNTPHYLYKKSDNLYIFSRKYVDLDLRLNSLFFLYPIACKQDIQINITLFVWTELNRLKHIHHHFTQTSRQILCISPFKHLFRAVKNDQIYYQLDIYY